TAPAFVDRLLSVASAEPVRTMADVETEWTQEIGQKRSMENLPPAPGETPLSWKERLAIATEKFRKAWRRWWNRRASLPTGAGRPLPELGSVFYGIMAICALVLLVSLLNSPNPLSFLFAIGMGVVLMLALLGALGGIAGVGS